MIRKARAVWKGGIRNGAGAVSTATGVLNEAPCGFESRFENARGTNPEELIGAAHAGCFAMALSKILGDAGLTGERSVTPDGITFDRIGEGFDITASHLRVSARIPGASEAGFRELANQAKAGCPVSTLMKAKLTMQAKLED